MPKIVERDALAAALDRFPPEQSRFMPTRLGNVLRRHEDQAGTQYRSEAPTIAPHLALHAPRGHVAFPQDARELLDLSIRICTLALVAATPKFIVLVPHGAWLLVALGPYAVAHIAYRGAILAADQYGRSLATLIDLDRFVLYEQLRVPAPATLADEQQRNEVLMDLLRGKLDNRTFAYAVPEPGQGAMVSTASTSDASAAVGPEPPPDNAGAPT